MRRVFTITIETTPIAGDVTGRLFQGDGFNVVIPIIIVAIIAVIGIAVSSIVIVSIISGIISRVAAISSSRVVIAICATASRAYANIPGSVGIA